MARGNSSGLGFVPGVIVGVVGVWAFHKWGHSIGKGKQSS